MTTIRFVLIFGFIQITFSLPCLAQQVAAQPVQMRSLSYHALSAVQQTDCGDFEVLLPKPLSYTLKESIKLHMRLREVVAECKKEVLAHVKRELAPGSTFFRAIPQRRATEEEIVQALESQWINPGFIYEDMCTLFSLLIDLVLAYEEHEKTLKNDYLSWLLERCPHHQKLLVEGIKQLNGTHDRLAYELVKRLTDKNLIRELCLDRLDAGYLHIPLVEPLRSLTLDQETLNNYLKKILMSDLPLQTRMMSAYSLLASGADLMMVEIDGENALMKLSKEMAQTDQLQNVLLFKTFRALFCSYIDPSFNNLGFCLVGCDEFLGGSFDLGSKKHLSNLSLDLAHKIFRLLAPCHHDRLKMSPFYFVLKWLHWYLSNSDYEIDKMVLRFWYEQEAFQEITIHTPARGSESMYKGYERCLESRKRINDLINLFTFADDYLKSLNEEFLARKKTEVIISETNEPLVRNTFSEKRLLKKLIDLVEKPSKE